MGGIAPGIVAPGARLGESPVDIEPAYVVWSISNVKIDGNEATFDIVAFVDDAPRIGRVALANPAVMPKNGDYWMVPKGGRGTLVPVESSQDAA